MNQHLSPVIDDKNPFYCPAIPASAYLESLQASRKRTRSHRPPGGDIDIFHSYQRILEESLHEGEGSEDTESGIIGSDWILGDYFTSGHGWFSSQSPGLEDLPPYSSTDLARAPPKMRHSNPMGPKPAETVIHIKRRQDPGLKRKGSFTDLDAPPKYARSLDSFHDSSFDTEIRRENLKFLAGESSPVAKMDVFRDFGMDDTGELIARMDLVLPGIRLAERLKSLEGPTAQAIMNFLSENDYINERTLDILRESDVEEITFDPSMFDRNGLNLCRREIYSVFNKPNAFRDLSNLSFAGIRLDNSDILHIHHLPSLSILLLNETGIGNEAVFLLVSLKCTLTRLSLATNPDIDDDAVPAILLLYKLSFLSILDTGIEMVGLRRLAETIHEDNRIIDIEIPFACEAYVDVIQTQYLCNPMPPLITNPFVCGQLSSVALKRNLEAHAACNPSIVPTGTRPEMIERLSGILKTRKLDMLVVGMLEGNDPVDEKYGAV